MINFHFAGYGYAVPQANQTKTVFYDRCKLIDPKTVLVRNGAEDFIKCFPTTVDELPRTSSFIIIGDLALANISDLTDYLKRIMKNNCKKIYVSDPFFDGLETILKAIGYRGEIHCGRSELEAVNDLIEENTDGDIYYWGNFTEVVVLLKSIAEKQGNIIAHLKTISSAKISLHKKVTIDISPRKFVITRTWQWDMQILMTDPPKPKKTNSRKLHNDKIPLGALLATMGGMLHR